jgi:hypothetical protein
VKLDHSDDWVGALAMALDEQTAGRHPLLAELDEWRLEEKRRRELNRERLRGKSRRPLPWQRAAA